MGVPNIDSTPRDNPFRYDTGFQVFLGIFTSFAILEFLLYGGLFTWGCGVIFWKKGSDRGTRFLSFLMLVCFWTLRLIYIPILIYNLPFNASTPFPVSELWINVSIWLMISTYVLISIGPMIVVLVKLIFGFLFKKKEKALYSDVY